MVIRYTQGHQKRKIDMVSKLYVYGRGKREQYIRVRAYLIWTKRGGGESSDEQKLNDWLTATFQINLEYNFL